MNCGIKLDVNVHLWCGEQVAGQSTLDNIDNWRWRFTMLLRDDNDQELVSTEKKDRRDFEQLSALATRMGLHWYLVLSNFDVMRIKMRSWVVIEIYVSFQPAIFKGSCF